ncbi:formylglycine-generating enzyme family protein [Mucilaginibacter angelicae]|uniref:Formylglycine-generating enzyme family protein n=1 Tax=Mucilaginibacter angelicae TaxID=869718 RepID=A0ABV6L6R2_9SPHI
MENLVIFSGEQVLELAFVARTPVGHPFLFGDEQAVGIPDFYIAATQVTQALWQFIMDDNPSLYRGNALPVEQVSWYQAQVFIEKLNQKSGRDFRLPTETEWEYAARGGEHWKDGFRFAGSNDMAESGWYEANAGPYTDLAMIRQLKNQAKLTQTHPVGRKKPNQLGLYDMNGNLWEWCQDWFVRDTSLIPKDGSAYNVPGEAKVLRGGCHHNWAEHCTNTKRYEIGPQFLDGCIGFRLALTQ